MAKKKVDYDSWFAQASGKKSVPQYNNNNNQNNNALDYDTFFSIATSNRKNNSAKDRSLQKRRRILFIK